MCVNKHEINKMNVQRKRIRPLQEKVIHVTQQLEISSGSRFRRISTVDKVIDVTVVTHRQVPTAQIVHRQWRFTRCRLSTQKLTSP